MTSGGFLVWFFIFILIVIIVALIAVIAAVSGSVAGIVDEEEEAEEEGSLQLKCAKLKKQEGLKTFLLLYYTGIYFITVISRVCRTHPSGRRP